MDLRRMRNRNSMRRQRLRQEKEEGYNLPRKEYEDLVCTFCKKYLSVPPIYTSLDGKLNKCGRCSTIPNDDLQQNLTYEKLAKYKKFPCSISQDCKHILQWQTSLEHEIICGYRCIPCPDPNCSQRYELKETENHFQQYHLENKYLVKHIKFHANYEVSRTVLICLNSAMVIIRLSECEQFLRILVTDLTTNIKQLQFCLRIHSANCHVEFVENCEILDARDEYIFNKESLQISKTFLKHVLLVDELSTGFDMELEILDQGRYNYDAYTIENYIINAVKCPGCRRILNGDIRICLGGHSICSTCISCVPCKSDVMPNSRNFTLENILTLLTIYFPDTIAEGYVRRNKTMSKEAQSNTRILKREVFQDLLCTFCEKYLSVSPIFTSQDGKINKCGRCSNLKTEKALYRNDLYEKIGKTMQFPCGESPQCHKSLTWNKARKHEQICPYRNITCPDPKCSVIFEINNARTHFKDCHQVYQCTNILKFDVEGTEKITLLALEDNNFIASYLIDEDYISLHIDSLSPDETKQTFSVTFSANNIRVVFNGLIDILPYGETSTENSIFKVKKSSVLDILAIDNESIKMCIQLEMFEGNFELPNLIQLELECPVCLGVMNSEIKLCEGGHSLCGNCRQTVTLSGCPVCRKPLTNIRNLALENIYHIFKRYF